MSETCIWTEPEMGSDELYDKVCDAIHNLIPRSKDYIIVMDNDEPNTAYIGDGFMKSLTLEDLKLLKEFEWKDIKLHGFKKYVEKVKGEPDNEYLEVKIKVLKKVDTKIINSEDEPTLDSIFLGKEVRIYPSDSYFKYGKVIRIDDHGVTFECTRCHERSGWTVGEIRFISFETHLTFSLPK